jgi:hypothetical protein
MVQVVFITLEPYFFAGVEELFFCWSWGIRESFHPYKLILYCELYFT